MSRPKSGRRQTTRYICPVCDEPFERYATQAPASGEPCCSTTCYTIHRVGKRITPHKLTISDEQLVTEHNAGATNPAIAKKYGVTRQAIHTRLKQAGVAFEHFSAFRDPAVRKRVNAKRIANSPRGKTHPRYRDLPMETIRHEYKAGSSPTELAQKYETGSEVIIYKLREIGETIRPPATTVGFGHYLVCSDGHIARSSYEAKTCEWLTLNKIPHETQSRLPFKINLWCLADFKTGETYIEVWGMERVPAYRAKMQKKLALYTAHNLKLLSLYAKDFKGQAYARKLHATLIG